MPVSILTWHTHVRLALKAERAGALLGVLCTDWGFPESFWLLVVIMIVG